MPRALKKTVKGTKSANTAKAKTARRVIKPWTKERIDRADHARHDLVHRRLVQGFDKAGRTRTHSRRNIETSNLIANGSAGRLVSAHHDREAGVRAKAPPVVMGTVMLTPRALIVGA